LTLTNLLPAVYPTFYPALWFALRGARISPLPFVF
jgi:hypothetical protein